MKTTMLESDLDDFSVLEVHKYNSINFHCIGVERQISKYLHNQN